MSPIQAALILLTRARRQSFPHLSNQHLTTITLTTHNPLRQLSTFVLEQPFLPNKFPSHHNTQRYTLIHPLSPSPPHTQGTSRAARAHPAGVGDAGACRGAGARPAAAASVAQGEEVELTHSQEHMAFMFSLQAQGEEVELPHSQEHVAFMFSLQAQGEEVELPHSQEHVAFMFSLQAQGEEELQTIQENYKSVYLHPATNACGLLSACSLLRVVDEVFAG
ncbi:uncharacterized protein LOC126993765 [Eriocheir sinensis]|uniref:uncharacterized protein LOC126993765 n=1 Tax=Eriocheir sinensis TaxID=95602 RepID=UPI0021C9F4DC|nr:uncharacterized protein LOC126993765 [Eriocheir sinensis]